MVTDKINQDQRKLMKNRDQRNRIGVNMKKTIEKYHAHVNKDENYNHGIEPYTEQQKCEAAIIQQNIEQLEASRRMFLGQDLVSCSLDEISTIGSKLEHSLRTVRATKARLYNEHIEKLKAKEQCLLEENARLCQENISLSQKQKDMVVCRQSIRFMEVETDLCIGPRVSQNAQDL
ncbi:hypothetical protein QVD17_08183 [Tagetes erecta]|uniref:K-box domain-containing protein n=1 Tax=Tagetes erecta TaxID=13708 RepID=A0AAD8KXT7_TARER|nr:hypothetical protein QVD17_08183 [Tagetes erecta]